MQESSQPVVVELNNGVKMPQVGLGTFKITSEAEKKSLRDAIMEVGYRHLDTATMYENEAVIGQVLQQCFAEGLKREDIFVTTKLLSCDYADPLAAVNRSLELLQLEYVDLYLVHFPIPFYDEKTKEFQKLPMHKLWASMEQLYKAGKARAIGISNFNVQLTLDLLSYAEVVPAVNQIELHPYLPQVDAVNWFKKQGIVPVAYSPFARHGNAPLGPDAKKDVLDHPLLEELAAKYGKTPGQVALNWGLARGHVVIPKSANKARQTQNLACFSFKLEPAEVEKISALDIGYRYVDFQYLEMYGGVPIFA